MSMSVPESIFEFKKRSAEEKNIGIEKSNYLKIFQRFYRGNSPEGEKHAADSHKHNFTS